MSDIHLHIFIRNFIKIAFGHFFYALKRFRQKLRHSELEATFGNIMRSDLPGKIIKSTEQMAVNLLQNFDRPNL